MQEKLAAAHLERIQRRNNNYEAASQETLVQQKEGQKDSNKFQKRIIKSGGQLIVGEEALKEEKALKKAQLIKILKDLKKKSNQLVKDNVRILQEQENALKLKVLQLKPKNEEENEKSSDSKYEEVKEQKTNQSKDEEDIIKDGPKNATYFDQIKLKEVPEVTLDKINPEEKHLVNRANIYFKMNILNNKEDV